MYLEFTEKKSQLKSHQNREAATELEMKGAAMLLLQIRRLP